MQAGDRAHRIGQKKAVLVLVLVAAGTIEEAILDRAQHKRDIDAKVIQVKHCSHIAWRKHDAMYLPVQCTAMH